MILAFSISGCNDCRNNDCGGDDTVLINVISDNEIDYTDSISFYYYDENQQKIEADIEPSSYSLQQYFAHLNYRLPGTKNRYYLEVGNQTKTVDIKTRYDKDPCCGDYLRFEELTVDGKTATIPIEIVIN